MKKHKFNHTAHAPTMPGHPHEPLGASARGKGRRRKTSSPRASWPRSPLGEFCTCKHIEKTKTIMISTCDNRNHRHRTSCKFRPLPHTRYSTCYEPPLNHLEALANPTPDTPVGNCRSVTSLPGMLRQATPLPCAASTASKLRQTVVPESMPKRREY